jgi:hypothetical protein
LPTLTLPSETTDVDALAAALDASTHDERLAWTRSLNRGEQYALYALCAGRAVKTADLVRAPMQVVRHYGRNGVPVPGVNLFEKRFVQLPDTAGGFNHNDFGWLSPILRPVVGPGHYVAYDSPDVPGEVWIDYRKVPATQHPDFPPLRGNEEGLTALVFGDMVDVLRRVSTHVFIGDSFKAKYPRPDKPPFLAWVGATFFATAPFVLCQESA